MKLYTNNRGDWAGTQSDARKQFKKDRVAIEVPTDKPNLMAFLNRNKVGSNSICSSNGSEILNATSTSWVAWALDTLNRGDISESKKMLETGLKAQYDRNK